MRYRYSGPSIEEEFKKKLSVVEQARARGANLDEMLRAIISGNKQGTVAEKVKMYQEQTGLKPFLEAMAKTAAIPLKEHLDSYIDNQIKVHHGNVSIPMMQSDLISVFRNKGLAPTDVYNEEFVRYLHEKLEAGKKQYQKDEPVEHQLGQIVDIDDDEADDFFQNMTGKNS